MHYSVNLFIMVPIKYMLWSLDIKVISQFENTKIKLLFRDSMDHMFYKRKYFNLSEN